MRRGLGEEIEDLSPIGLVPALEQHRAETHLLQHQRQGSGPVIHTGKNQSCGSGFNESGSSISMNLDPDPIRIQGFDDQKI